MVSYDSAFMTVINDANQCSL